MILLHRLLLSCLLVLYLSGAKASPDEDTDKLIKQGHQALATGQAEQAVLIFERVILDNPSRLGVLMDYGLALQLTGDKESAQAIFRHLLTQNPPEHLRLWLREQVQKELPSEKKWVSAGTITLLVGQDSNLNRATTAGNLTLTYPFGPLVLSLADNARAKAGAAGLLNMSWEASHLTAGGSDWSLQAGLTTRVTPGTQAEDYLQPIVGLTRRWSGNAADEIVATLAYQQLHYGGQTLQRVTRAGLYQGQPRWTGQSNCSMFYGAELKWLTYPMSSVLNSQYLGLAASLGCTQEIGWNLLAHAGIDRGENQRPGGDQQQIDLRAQIYDRLGPGQWLAEAGLANLRDAAGYSPLLGNNDVRKIWRGYLTLEYAHPINHNLQGIVRLEAFRQRSSLPLFETQGEAFWMGLRYSF